MKYPFTFYLVVLGFFLSSSFPAFSQDDPMWTWQKGDEVIDEPGVYGTQGVPDPANKPGARQHMASSKSDAGHLYMFGGFGADNTGAGTGNLNDLWRYDPGTNEWTWIKGDDVYDQAGVYGTKGITDPSNNPGGRQGAGMWKNSAGNFYLFGGNGYDILGNFGELNDLWRYDVAANEWTWLKGDSVEGQPGVYGDSTVADPANNPGGRQLPATWIDESSGDLYLFGGEGYDAQFAGWTLNDLWRYDSANNEWTWLKGDSIGGQGGVYGTQGTSDPNNKPGARFGAVTWQDDAGNFYLFGGTGRDASATYGRLNDLWRYDPSTNEWTWVKGDDVVDEVGVYGTQGVSGPSNKPGARTEAVGWADTVAGDFYLYGGSACDTGSCFPLVVLNDLWRYDPSTNEWTWLRGDSLGNRTGNYGTQGVAAPANRPGARSGATAWFTAPDNLWIFGGFGYDEENWGFLNGLWVFRQCIHTTAILDPVTCGDPYTAPSGAVFSTTGVYTDTIPNEIGCDSVITIDLTVVTFDTTVTQSDNTLNSATAGVSYQWVDCDAGLAPVSGATSRDFAPEEDGTYAVILSESGCTDTSGCHTVTGVHVSSIRDGGAVTVYPNPSADGYFVLDLGENYTTAQVEVRSLDGRVMQRQVGENVNKLSIDLRAHPAGIYVGRVITGEKVAAFRLVKQ